MIKNIVFGLFYMTVTFFLTLILRVNHYKLFDALVHWETVVYFIAGIVLWGFVLIFLKQSFVNSEQSEDVPEQKVRSKPVKTPRGYSPARRY